MVVIPQYGVDPVLAFNIFKRLIAFFPDQIVQAVVGLVSAEQNHIRILPVDPFRQFLCVLPAKKAAQMDIRHQHHLHRPGQVFPCIVFHYPHHRVQGIPSSIDDDSHDDDESAFGIQGVGMLPAFPASCQGTNDPQKDVQDARVGGIMEKGKPVSAQIGKGTQYLRSYFQTGSPHVHPAEQKREQKQKT